MSSSYVILRSGCHECGEPVELLPGAVSFDQTIELARGLLAEGRPWRDVELEVWRVDTGAVTHVADVAFNKWADGGPRVQVDYDRLAR